MRSVELENANMTLAGSAREAGEEPPVITEHGKLAAVLLRLENTDLETAALSSNRASSNSLSDRDPECGENAPSRARSFAAV